MIKRDQIVISEEADGIDLGFLRTCVDDAARATVALWDTAGKTFWRSTEQRERESSKGTPKFFPTVTLRSVDALISLHGEYPEWTQLSASNVIFKEIVASLAARDHSSMDSTLNADKGQEGPSKELNLFTLALYVQVFSRICVFKSLTLVSADLAQPRLEASVRELVNRPSLKSAAAGKTVNEHPFILYQTCRALSLSLRVLKVADIKVESERLLTALLARTRESVEQLLAKHVLGVLNPGESVALAFCASSLALFGQTEDRPYILPAMEVCFETQDPGGCWALGRVIRKNKDIDTGPLEITTYEIAGVAAEMMCELARKKRDILSTKLGRKAVERLVRAAQYAERSLVRIGDSTAPQAGWCSDHAYGNPLIESWTSGIVLQSLLNLNKLVQEAKRQKILGTFTSIFPDDRDWPVWLRWEKFVANGEVDLINPVLGYLEEKVIKPILVDPRGMPPLKPRSVSVLLFGPPGTSKTTIVKAIADALNWPVVVLSPGNFIEEGLEFIEAQAKRVFDRLLELSRAVVIFDECDELFRDRAPLEQTEQTRGITAFVTASMLPKLQDLHDRGKVLFFICTNNFASMDSAVKRGGRIDHIIGVGSPDLGSRKKIIAQTWEELKSEMNWKEPGSFPESLGELAFHTERFTRAEIQRAVRILGRAPGWTDAAEARAAAVKCAERLKDALTISENEFKSFVELRDKVSHAILERI